MKIKRASFEIFGALFCIILKCCIKEQAPLFSTSDIIYISGITASGVAGV